MSREWRSTNFTGTITRPPRADFFLHESLIALLGHSLRSSRSPIIFGLTPGHVFVQDDFAAYVMHAANLVEHRRYTAIRYVANPEAPWVSPANGYPPVYPLLLAPVYWQRGPDLRAMKIVTVCTFAVFLAAFAKWVGPLVSPRLRVMAVLLVGLSPAFWSYRDLVSSEFPYLMMSFLASLAIRQASSRAEGSKCQTGWLCWLRFCCTPRTAREPSPSRYRSPWFWRS